MTTCPALFYFLFKITLPKYFLLIPGNAYPSSNRAQQGMSREACHIILTVLSVSITGRWMHTHTTNVLPPTSPTPTPDPEAGQMQHFLKVSPGSLDALPASCQIIDQETNLSMACPGSAPLSIS